MRRVILIQIVLAVAVGVVSTAAASSAGPRVWLADRSPAVVRGASFKHAESVLITLSVGRVVLRKRVVASPTGAIVARWSRSVPSGCVMVAVVATGSEGSRAAYKLAPPDCAPLQPASQ